MKTQISMNRIPAKKLYRAGYCELQAILNKHDAQFYNAGVYGWNCDIFVDWKTDTAITTGYRNMRGARVPEVIIEKYNAAAKEIDKEMWTCADYSEKKQQLIRDFWDELESVEV